MVMTSVIAILVILTVVTASLGGAYAARAQAQAAADAAALAAAVATYPAAGRPSPDHEAGRVAGLNQARLVSCRCPRDASLDVRAVTVVTAVDVTVPIFGRLAVNGAATAEFDPRRWLGR